MDAPPGQMHQSEYADLVLYFCCKRLVLCFVCKALGSAVATSLRMGAEPEAAQITRLLGRKKEAENGSQGARVSRAVGFPSHPEQDWSRVSQWGILTSYAGTWVSVHR